MILKATVQQMFFLLFFIILGYILNKFKLLPENSEKVLSKLENYIFIPALVLSTFINNFTLDKLTSAGKLLTFSIIIEVVVIFVAFVCTRFITKDKYVRKIYLYGLCFSNFGFMGNAVVSALFPDVFLEYVIFTIVLWIVIYLWGVPNLLMESEQEHGIKARLKNLMNPMLIGMLVGIVIGLTGIKLPNFATSAIDSASACMSPIAMLITGITIAKIDIKSVLKIKSIYVVTMIRLIIIPMIFIGLYYIFKIPISKTFLICAVASLSMPLGLNTIVIPSSYGKDTTVASGMALISHVLSILTIPLIFCIAGL